MFKILNNKIIRHSSSLTSFFIKHHFSVLTNKQLTDIRFSALNNVYNKINKQLNKIDEIDEIDGLKKSIYE